MTRRIITFPTDGGRPKKKKKSKKSNEEREKKEEIKGTLHMVTCSAMTTSETHY